MHSGSGDNSNFKKFVILAHEEKSYFFAFQHQVRRTHPKDEIVFGIYCLTGWSQKINFRVFEHKFLFYETNFKNLNLMMKLAVHIYELSIKSCDLKQLYRVAQVNL